jgi:ATP-binding cassette subfamily B protein
MRNEERSGLRCLQELVTKLHLAPDWDSVVDDDLRSLYERDPMAALKQAGEEFEYQPEVHDISELREYPGPAIVQLKNNEYVCAVNISQLAGGKVGLFNPRGEKGPCTIVLPAESLLQIASGPCMIFRNLRDFDAKRHSAVFALVTIANHHRIPLNCKRVMHDYAIETDELTPRQVERIGRENQLKIEYGKMTWNTLSTMGKAFPCIWEKKDGKHAIICGYRRKEEGDPGEIAVLDPNGADPAPGQRFLQLGQKEFEEQGSGRGFFVKRVWKLFDKDRPFGLLWFVPEFLKLKQIFTHIAFAVLMINVIALVMPLFFQIIVDKVLVSKSYNTLNVLVFAIIAILIFNSVMEYLRGYLLLFGTNKIDISTATKVFDKLLSLPIDFFDRIPSGVLLKHMQQTEKIRGFLSGSLFFTVLELTSLFIFIPFLLLYSVRLTCVVLAFSLAMAAVIATLIKPFQRRLQELYQAEGKRQSMLVESIHGMRTVKSLSLEPVQKEAWADSTAFAVNAYFRVGKISITAKTLSQLLEMLMNVTVIWLGTLAVFNGSMSVGALIAFQMISGRVTGPLVKLVSLVHEYQQIAISVEMLGVVMNSMPEPAGGGVRNPFKGQISFEHVDFRYRVDGPLVLRDLTFTLQPGEVIGIVGRSGSGKTTLTKLLQGLYPVLSGLIKIDGIDLREIDKVHLRNSIGVVLQENYFFSGTVRENLSLTKRNATLDEIIAATKLAGADEFVQNLPKGYDTMLEENASNLSGGQKQRLAIARALLTNPRILIFDEATSALDPESENVIQENLPLLARGRTVLIISHRLSIVSGADKTIVLDKGELADFAPHKELLSHPGVYKDFWHQQMERNINR